MKFTAHILVLLAYCSYGQKIELTPSNPAPRIGQDVQITLSLSDDENKLDSAVKFMLNGLGSGKYTFYPMDTGTIFFGPLSLKINGVVFQSDSIELKILPLLPSDKMGVWIRQERFQQKDFLVVEQIIRSDWLENKTQNIHGFDPKLFGQSGIGELNPDSFIESQVSIELHYASSKSQSISVGNKSPSESKALYRIYTYEILKGPEFKGEYIITRNHFNNLPKAIGFKKWTLK